MNMATLRNFQRITNLYLSSKLFNKLINSRTIIIIIIITEAINYVGRGFAGLEVACWPLVPKFAGSNAAEAVGFFRVKKSSARLPSEGK